MLDSVGSLVAMLGTVNAVGLEAVREVAAAVAVVPPPHPVRRSAVLAMAASRSFRRSMFLIPSGPNAPGTLVAARPRGTTRSIGSAVTCWGDSEMSWSGATVRLVARSTLSQLRRVLYLTQRDIGDVQAAERGPGAYAKRVVRRKVTRSLFRLLK